MSLFGPLLPVFLAAAALVAPAPAPAADSLARFRWKARVLLVVAPAASDARVTEQKRIFELARRGMKERELVLHEVLGEGPGATATRRRLDIAKEEFTAILIGKDGGEKLRSAAPLSAEQLFETIDDMPMRREEMRRHRSG